MNDKIDGILNYIFSSSYQEEVECGYGIGMNGKRGFVKSSFYAVGWDVCLLHLTPRQEIVYMLLFASIDSARRSEWHRQNIYEL